MDQQLVDRFLISDSDEIADLKANLETLNGFINLVYVIDGLPDNTKRFYEESRSLYQTTVIKRDIADLENLLSKFFGAPVKPAGKPLARKYRKSSVVKYLGGLEKDQSLFVVELKTGQFYGALWPWRRNKAKIEIHMGYCSDWMTDDDYEQLENLVHQCVSDHAFKQMDAGIGGQIHGISLPSFLQMAEMEESSFTLRVTSRNRVGELYLSEGKLMTARFDDLAGSQAAFRIISWENVTIDIEPPDPSKQDEIKQPLMHILMESLKLKDESGLAHETAPLPPKGRPKPMRSLAAGKPSKRLVRLERAPTPRVQRKRLSFLTLIVMGVAGFAILAAMVMGYFYYLDNLRSLDDFQELLAQEEKTDILEKKVELFHTYQKDHPNSPHKTTIKTRIAELEKQIEDRDFDQTMLAVSGLPLDEHYEEKAIQLFSRYLEKYPDTAKREQINKAVAQIKDLLDQYFYEELKRAARLDFNKRLDTYRRYLEKFPEGSYRQDVQVLINEMGEKYLVYLQDEALQCEQKRDWEPCIEHCENFVQAYAGLSLSQKAAGLKKQLEDKRDYFELRKKIEVSGGDFESERQYYISYLESHPDSAQRQEIEKELASLDQKRGVRQNWLAVRAYADNDRIDLFARIQKVDGYLRSNISGPYADEAQSLLRRLEQERLDSLRKSRLQTKIQSQRAEQQRLREEQTRRQQRVRQLQADLEVRLKDSSRYRSNGDGTFKDIATGLTWCILDSYQELGGCVTYAAASKYIQELHHGGYAAWRLPSAGELASLYKQPPYFPHSGARWYWSGETAVKGYHTVADVVSSEHESVFQRQQRDLSECGHARAVLAVQP